MTDYTYDVAVIGSGPGGQRAAIQAGKLGKRVAIIEKKQMVGGVCVNDGTVPSKTLREAVMYLTGYREHELYGASYQVKQTITMEDLLFRCENVVQHEIDVLRSQLARNRVNLINGLASFVDPHTLQVENLDGTGTRQITAENVVIAVGTTANYPAEIPVDNQRVFVPDTLLGMQHIPRTLVVIGGGVIGMEYASMFAELGVRVTVVESRPSVLSFVDREIVDNLTYHLRAHRVVLRLGEPVQRVEVDGDSGVRVYLESGKQILGEAALYSVGRVGATDSLNLAAAGIHADDRGRIKVDDNYMTRTRGIYAVGDVIGFPSLASTSREQGRSAVAHAFGIKLNVERKNFPYGIYSLPEISFVGQTEEELTEQDVPYEVGAANYREITRGQILGDTTGRLKLIFHRETLDLLGVHIIGEGAAELIHIGQAVLALNGKVDYFVDTVFNYPTLAECYKVAAFDGLNRIGRFW
jgi:NAD(P) transhydrogenase